MLGHPIADAHPGDLDSIVFPGQDYNNARVYDFEDVDKWESNKRESPYAYARRASTYLSQSIGSRVREWDGLISVSA
jgi:hypothetical protein